MAAPVRLTPVKAPASSVDFDRVYCVVAVNPFLSRRRSSICPAWRDEVPFDVRYTNPAGQAGHGFTAPAGYVFGRNSCIKWLPLAPKYVAIIVSDAGRSRCIDTCQFWAEPTRKSESTANVLGVTPGDAMNPFSSVNVGGLNELFCTLSVFESGGCCAMSMAID